MRLKISERLLSLDMRAEISWGDKKKISYDLIGMTTSALKITFHFHYSESQFNISSLSTLPIRNSKQAFNECILSSKTYDYSNCSFTLIMVESLDFHSN